MTPLGTIDEQYRQKLAEIQHTQAIIRKLEAEQANQPNRANDNDVRRVLKQKQEE